MSAVSFYWPASQFPIYVPWAAGEEWIDSIPLTLAYIQNLDIRGDSYDGGFERIVKELGGRKRDRSVIGNMGKGRAKAGQVRYWQYGQAEKLPDLAISDLGPVSLPAPFSLPVPAGY